MQFVAYYRVSTQEQGRSGLGLDAQERAVTMHVRAKRGKIIASFTEVESGKRSDRPQLAFAMEMAAETGAVLLIAKLDRLARSVHFISTLLLDPKLEIEACDLPAANKMTLHLMAAVAEGEAAAISARTKAALGAARRRGVLLGVRHPAKAGREAEISQSGRKVMRERADRLATELGPMIHRLRLDGQSYKQVAEHFTLINLPAQRKQARRGRTVWHQDRIRQIYRRYCAITPNVCAAGRTRAAKKPLSLESGKLL